MKRTYVLVHGAVHGGWCWRYVASRLRSAGHEVYTPTQTGLGERRHLMSRDITIDTFVDDIAQVFEAEELTDVYLVGHSFGGNAVLGVADRMPQRVRHLVLLDALVPTPGKSIFDGLPPDVAASRQQAAEQSTGGLSMPAPPATAFGLVPGRDSAEDIAWVNRRLTPHPWNTFLSVLTLKNPVGNGVPATYIRCTDPSYPVVGPSAEIAKGRVDWRYLELRTGHDAMVSAPAELTQLLTELD